MTVKHVFIVVIVVMKVVVMVKGNEVMRQVLDMLGVVVMEAYSDGSGDESGSDGEVG